MSAHLSEEEQVEALKRWWQRNGRTTIIAVVLGIAAWWGFQQWTEQQQLQRESNSILYLQVQMLAQANSLTDQQKTELWNKSNMLKEQAEGTQYGWYSALQLAKLAFENTDYVVAAAELQYVLDGDADQSLKDIAQLRLARVEANRNDTAKAFQLLNVANVGGLAAAYAELRGDLYMQQGDTEAARIAYQEAINSATEVDRNAVELLQLKLNRVTPTDVPAGKVEQSVEATEQEQAEK